MKKTYLNLGCGNHINKSTKEIKWVNVDDYEFSKQDDVDFMRADIRKLPFESDSVDYILLDQVLEHIPMADIYGVLCEIRRVLKKGGKCSIVVPDFEGAVNQWLEVNHNGAFDPQKYKWFSEVIYGNQVTDGEYHRTPMCAGYLHFMFNLAGLFDHTISFWPAYGKIPNCLGMRPYLPNASLRNAQLVADIIKTS